ncbi:hypothetical protein [Streptomyces griseocarneus]|uniref:hypothetical protein n=1 Tax=Streptomyces griseocarneus TaxID=51201 RepID=UPI00167EC02D|nr:hypothetical protein [Streptomyces griseocarneus]MBZ6475243.1 hypothetical protein [Streptomyces griseocarneus]GHG61456.1 hypothetical protein GCM10018779_29350 [Streptomyces griseocarneus]
MALRDQTVGIVGDPKWGSARHARARARAIFAAPSAGRVSDPVIGRVQKARAIAGLLTTFLLISVYGVDGGWSSVFADGLAKLFLAPLILILVGPLVIAGFIWYAPPQHRALLRSRLRYPLKAIGWYLGVPGAAVAGFLGLAGLLKLLQDVLVAQMLIGLFTLVVGVPYVIWATAFLFFSSGAAARYAFNTADVHAALPAVLTAVLVWVLNLVQLGDGLPNGPLPVQIAAFLGGPLSVTAVSYWEVRVLRTRYGVRVRG